MNRLRARVRRFRPIYIDIYDGEERKRTAGKKERKNGLRGGTRLSHGEKERALKGKGGTGSRFGEGKGKGPEKTPKQIRVPSLTDRKFVEVRPGDSASRLSRHEGPSYWPIGMRPIVS